jgi:hypothetical protein
VWDGPLLFCLQAAGHKPARVSPAADQKYYSPYFRFCAASALSDDKSNFSIVLSYSVKPGPVEQLKSRGFSAHLRSAPAQQNTNRSISGSLIPQEYICRTKQEPNMQRAGRSSPFKCGGRAEKCQDDMFYCMDALLTIATYDSATQTHKSTTLNFQGKVTDSLCDWLKLFLTYFASHLYIQSASAPLSHTGRLCPPATNH